MQLTHTFFVGTLAAMKKLKKYLSAAKIEQLVFASMVNTTPSTLSRVLNGKQPPTLQLALDIEKVTEGKVRCEDWV